ncbi:uncharacterized protein [Chelonus insularis]|uniref:uncharacterized protein n=1 Tax=Chelonus insularis TaxID=460826 RepID=UPI00158DA3FC|nr:uncharacterized protein LOC118067207 [Chelonus insularis]
MMFVEILFIGFLINIRHCQGKENILTNDEVLNPHFSSVLKNEPNAQEKFSATNGLIFTHIPTSNEYVNHHTPFGVKSLGNSGGPYQLNYFTPNDQLLLRNHAPVSTNTFTENSYQTSQRQPSFNSYPMNPISYFILPPKPNPGQPFFPQQKYSRSYLTLYTKPYLRSISEYVILRVSPRLNLKPPFNSINSQRDGPNQVSRNEYFYRPSVSNNLIHQTQDTKNSEQALRNKFIELNNQAFTGRQNSVYSQPINPFLMRIIQSNDRNNRAKKHINFHSHSNLISNNSSAENCPGCGSFISVHSTPKPESSYSLINLTSNITNETSKLNETMMISNMTANENNSTLNEWTHMNSRNINSTNEILASTERVISTTSDLNYGYKIPIDDILKVNDKGSETKSSTEIIVVFDKKNSIPE